jgi:hypothetical protein
MSKVKFISSPTEIPAGQTFILVKYGEESGQTTAKEIAKRESISNVFALK